MAAPRLSTRDLTGPLLIFVGAFLLAAALTLPTLFVDKLRTIPLSTDVTTTATTGASPSGDPARILDRCSLATPSARIVDADITRQQRFVAVRPADARRVTLQAGTSMRVERLHIDGRTVDADAPRPGSAVPPAPGAEACTDPVLSAVRDRITLNRRTALPDLAGGGSSEVQYDSGSAPVRLPDRRGYTYLLPFGVSAVEHTFFDITTRRSVPLRPSGETTVSGHDALRFVAEVPDTDLHSLGNGVGLAGASPTSITRPAGWFGVPGIDPARELTANLHHQARWEIAVDAASGTLVDQRVTITEEYRLVGAGLPDHRITNVAATFGFDHKSQRRQVTHATALTSPITIWGRVVPILAAILGFAAVGAGLAFLMPERFRRLRAAWSDRRRSS